MPAGSVSSSAPKPPDLAVVLCHGFPELGYSWRHQIGALTNRKVKLEIKEIRQPELDAAVVYYGSTPGNGDFTVTRIPVLGLYGGDDNRVNATIPAADSGMRAANRSFESHVFAGAGHGFLRARSDSARGAQNSAASRAAWPLTVLLNWRHPRDK